MSTSSSDKIIEMHLSYHNFSNIYRIMHYFIFIIAVVDMIYAQSFAAVLVDSRFDNATPFGGRECCGKQLNKQKIHN